MTVKVFQVRVERGVVRVVPSGPVPARKARAKPEGTFPGSVETGVERSDGRERATGRRASAGRSRRRTERVVRGVYESVDGREQTSSERTRLLLRIGDRLEFLDGGLSRRHRLSGSTAHGRDLTARMEQSSALGPLTGRQDRSVTYGTLSVDQRRRREQSSETTVLLVTFSARPLCCAAWEDLGRRQEGDTGRTRGALRGSGEEGVSAVERMRCWHDPGRLGRGEEGERASVLER